MQLFPTWVHTSTCELSYHDPMLLLPCLHSRRKSSMKEQACAFPGACYSSILICETKGKVMEMTERPGPLPLKCVWWPHFYSLRVLQSLQFSLSDCANCNVCASPTSDSIFLFCRWTSSWPTWWTCSPSVWLWPASALLMTEPWMDWTWHQSCSAAPTRS